LACGANDVGLIGVVACAAIDSGASIMAVIPDHLMRAERSKRTPSQLAFPETIQACKKVMVTTSDTIIGLPRVAGSPDAFFEGLTLAGTDLHKKPIFRLRTNGCLYNLMYRMNLVVDQGFAKASLTARFMVVDTVKDLSSCLEDILAVQTHEGRNDHDQ